MGTWPDGQGGDPFTVTSNELFRPYGRVTHMGGSWLCGSPSRGVGRIAGGSVAGDRVGGSTQRSLFARLVIREQA
ncbi:hypothetical protein SAMN05421505_108135 [Sinosporangium album]|uniref:Uncharacterized protein n=1 Tax=Sinosporangium album TaxID=504805 RepID=A0A1G7XD93_9ACTN|nr:hypothetical protein SAMN05421505_108135 [Sinosporangium album]